jgi:putative transposase
MSNYLRPRRPGATVFLTITLAARGSQILTDRIEVLRKAVRDTRAARPFHIDAWVVLPDHMHCVWTLPEGDHGYAARVQQIKARFSRAMPKGPRRASHIARREQGIWQRRFWEHHIRDMTDYQNHMAYCWYNPIKHGFVENVHDWPYSSWHRDNRSDGA